MARKYHIGYISFTGSSGYQKRLLEEGHTLSIWWYDAKEKNPQDYTGLKNLYPKQYNILAGEKWKHFHKLQKCDFIITDHNDSKQLHEIDEWLDHPHIFRPSNITKMMEDDREFGKMIAEYLGLDIPNGGVFCQTQDKALRFLFNYKETDRVVMKGIDQTIIPHHVGEAIDIVRTDSFNLFGTRRETITDAGGKKKTFKLAQDEVGIFIQDFVDGPECCFGGYFNGYEFVGPICCPSEVKGSEPNNRGSILTGEIATITRFAKREELPPPIRLAIERLEVLLHTCAFTGYIDFNTIVNNTEGYTKYYFLEFTPRMGYPSSEIQIMAHMKINGYGYGEFLARATGFSKDDVNDLFDMTQPWAVSNALYAAGLGLGNFDHLSMVHPKVQFKYGADSTIGVDVCGFNPDYDKNGDMIVSEWDRVLFVSTIDKDPILCERHINETMQDISCWGHTWRDDVTHWSDKVRDIFIPGYWKENPNPPARYSTKYKISTPGKFDKKLWHSLLAIEHWTSRNYDDVSFTPKDLKRKMESKDWIIIYAEHGEKIISFLLFHLDKKRKVAYGHANATLSFMIPAHERSIRGIGWKLLKFSHPVLKRLGMKTITGTAENRVSILHRSLGYATRRIIGQPSKPASVVVTFKL